MEIEVKSSETLEEGKHKGVITRLEYREEPYRYTDVTIECEQRELRVSYPTTVSEKSALGQLLTRFGADLKVGLKVDPEKVLVEKPCQFVSTIKKTDNGEFTEVFRESVRPIVKEKVIPEETLK